MKSLVAGTIQSGSSNQVPASFLEVLWEFAHFLIHVMTIIMGEKVMLVEVLPKKKKNAQLVHFIGTYSPLEGTDVWPSVG